jgi:3-oxoacyl-[acyl-carrier protein] reductase
MELSGKNIIITGGLSGLGLGITHRLCQEKANVTVFDINAENYRDLQAELPDLAFYPCDVTDVSAVEQTVNKYFKEFGHIDALINNAGILYNAPLVRLSPSGIEKHDINMWRRVIETDLSSVFYMTTHVVEKMVRKRTKGVIINISSVCAAGNPGQSAYSAAKAGVNALTRTWAKELGPYGIRVAAVSPGFFDTPSTHDVMSEANLKEVIKEVPLRRLGCVDEVAEGVVSILKNDYCSGAVFELTGGLVI